MLLHIFKGIRSFFHAISKIENQKRVISIREKSVDGIRHIKLITNNICCSLRLCSCTMDQSEVCRL